MQAREAGAGYCQLLDTFRRTLSTTVHSLQPTTSHELDISEFLCWPGLVPVRLVVVWRVEGGLLEAGVEVLLDLEAVTASLAA